MERVSDARTTPRNLFDSQSEIKPFLFPITISLMDVPNQHWPSRCDMPRRYNDIVEILGQTRPAFVCCVAAVVDNASPERCLPILVGAYPPSEDQQALSCWRQKAGNREDREGKPQRTQRRANITSHLAPPLGLVSGMLSARRRCYSCSSALVD